MERRRRNIIIILMGSVLGSALSIWLTYIHYRLYTDFGYESFCGHGDTINCETVASSSMSVLFHLPISGWGILGYLSVVILAMFDMGAQKKDQTIGTLLLVCGGLAAGSVFYAAASFIVVKATCMLCMACHVLNWGMAAVAAIEIQKRGGLKENLSRELEQYRRSPWVPGYLLGLLVLGVLAGPVGFVPRYHSHAFFRNVAAVPTGIDDQGRAWIGATEPTITIHEYFDYECPSCRLSHIKIRRALAKKSDAIRLVRHNFARMRCVPNDSVKRFDKCGLARGAYCAEKQGKHWQWNDAIVAGPKPIKGPLRRTFDLDLARKLQLDMRSFESCLFERETIEYVHNQYQEAKKKRVVATPMYIINGKKLTLKEVAKYL